METDRKDSTSSKITERKESQGASVPRGLTKKIKDVISSNVRDYKINNAYINLISPETIGHLALTKKITSSSIANLSVIVRESLVKEFGVEIKQVPHYENLVDLVMNKIMAESLNDFDDNDDA